MLRVPFRLGRPGLEADFEVNPSAWNWDSQSLSDEQRAIDGTLNVVTLSRDRPSIRLNGNYITPGMWATLKSIIDIDDTPLIFEPFAFDFSSVATATPPTFPNAQVDETFQVRIVPTTTTSLKLPPTSASRASRLRLGVLAPATLRITSGRLTYGGGGYARAGATEFFSNASGTSYSQNFEGLGLGDLAGQDSWVKLAGGAGDRIDVVATSPITGLQSAAMTSTGIPRTYRRLLGFTTTCFTADLKFRVSSATGFAGTSFYFANADGLGGPYPFRLVIATDLSGAVVYKLFTFSMGVEVTSGPAFTVPAAVGTVQTVRLEFYDGVVALYLAGSTTPSLIASTGYRTVDRLIVSGTPGVVAVFTFDDLVVSKLNGAYDHLTNTITLANPLGSLAPVYVGYQAVAQAVWAKKLPVRQEGGWVSKMRYDLELTGA